MKRYEDVNPDAGTVEAHAVPMRNGKSPGAVVKVQGMLFIHAQEPEAIEAEAEQIRQRFADFSTALEEAGWPDFQLVLIVQTRAPDPPGPQLPLARSPQILQ